MRGVRRPTLKTARLTLRPLDSADAASVQRLAGDWEIADKTLNIPHPYGLSAAQDWIAGHQEAADQDQALPLAIVLTTDGVLLGAVGMTLDMEHRRGSLGYWIGRPYWGSGYCTEAATALLKYGFEKLGLHKVHAQCLCRNPASARVLEKLGMVQEGLLRDHYCKWGRFEDVAEYAVLRKDFPH